MALTNSQGTKVYLVPAGTNVSTKDDIETAIADASCKEIGCIQDLGDLSSTRSVQEYSCLDTDNVSKSFGSMSYGNFTVGMLFDGADEAGQAELKTMYSDNTMRIGIVALVDGTYFTFDTGVSGQAVSIQKDNAVLINSTVEIASKIMEVR